MKNHHLQFSLLTPVLALCILVLTSCTQTGSQSPSAGAGSTPTPGAGSSTNALDLPFDYEFGSDGRIYFLVNGAKYPAEFSAWGSHANGHTGHIEGDAKSNYSVYIQPPNQLIQLSTGGGQLFGVTASVALQNAPWYKATMDNMKIQSIEKRTGSDLSDYVAGEGNEWVLEFSVASGFGLRLLHLGALSGDLTNILANVFGEGVRTSPDSVNFNDSSKYPISVPKGTVLARPQITKSFQETINNQTVYYAHAQVEWSFSKSDDSYNKTTCGYSLLDTSLQQKLQTALEESLLHPISYGRFTGYSNATAVPAHMAAHGDICANPYLSVLHSSYLSNQRARAWHDNQMTYSTKGEVLVMYPVGKNNRVYTQLGANLFEDAKVNFILVRQNAESNAFEVQDSVDNTYSVTSIYGQVLDITPDEDTVANTSLIVKITFGRANDAEFPQALVGKYWPIRYAIRSDRLLVHYGKLYSSKDAAMTGIPMAIPETVTADGNPHFGYDHNFLTLR